MGADSIGVEGELPEGGSDGLLADGDSPLVGVELLPLEMLGRLTLTRGASEEGPDKDTPIKGELDEDEPEEDEPGTDTPIREVCNMDTLSNGVAVEEPEELAALAFWLPTAVTVRHRTASTQAIVVATPLARAIVVFFGVALL